MLKGIHPLLGPDLLSALRQLGHGDEIVIADANFPAHSLGPKVIRLDGIDAVSTVDAILTHLPLDTFSEAAAFRMAVVDDPSSEPPICRTFADLLTRLAGPFTIVPRPGITETSSITNSNTWRPGLACLGPLTEPFLSRTT